LRVLARVSVAAAFAGLRFFCVGGGRGWGGGACVFVQV